MSESGMGVPAHVLPTHGRDARATSDEHDYAVF